MISLDCETTGLDVHHGARPFLVTTCDGSGVNTWWEWDVNPMTREVTMVYEDLIEIQEAIGSADLLVLQNAKFDYQMLWYAFCGKLRWDWGKVRDTLLAGHLLRSNQPHDLTTMVLVYLGVNVQPLEDDVKKATQEARRIGKQHRWRIARKDLPEMPSARDSTWKYDMWLPRLIAREEKYPKDHSWRTVCSEYANGDSSSTIALWRK